MRMFESGDCIIKDSAVDTRARNLRKLAVVITD